MPSLIRRAHRGARLSARLARRSPLGPGASLALGARNWNKLAPTAHSVPPSTSSAPVRAPRVNSIVWRARSPADPQSANWLAAWLVPVMQLAPPLCAPRHRCAKTPPHLSRAAMRRLRLLDRLHGAQLSPGRAAGAGAQTGQIGGRVSHMVGAGALESLLLWLSRRTSLLRHRPSGRLSPGHAILGGKS